MIQRGRVDGKDILRDRVAEFVVINALHISAAKMNGLSVCSYSNIRRAAPFSN